MLLPLVTLPYVIRIIGLEYFGRIAFAQALVGYLVILVNYGFHLTGTQEIAVNKNRIKKVRKLFYEVTSAKLILLFFSLLILECVLAIFPSLNSIRIIYYLVFIQLMSMCMVPNFFLQGMQDLKWVSIVTVVLKLVGVLIIFWKLKSKDDYYYYVLGPALMSLCTLVISYLYIFRKYTLNFKAEYISVSRVMYQYRTGFYVFLSQVKITFFNNLNVLVVGSVLGDKAVGIFSSADKIIKVLSAIQIPIVTALYPYFSQQALERKAQIITQINRIAKFGALLYLIPVSLVFIFSDYILLYLFGGEELTMMSQLVKIMCFIPVLVFLNNLYGTQYLLNLHKKKLFLLSFILAAITNLAIIYPFILFFGLYGVAYSVLCSEIILCASMFYFARRTFIKSQFL